MRWLDAAAQTSWRFTAEFYILVQKRWTSMRARLAIFSQPRRSRHGCPDQPDGSDAWQSATQRVTDASLLLEFAVPAFTPSNPSVCTWPVYEEVSNLQKPEVKICFVEKSRIFRDAHDHVYGTCLLEARSNSPSASSVATGFQNRQGWSGS
ncbi:hypothetical protein TGPRC2_277730 [Toxoplasma gondii TgCatPRC2]|uniref:Uncharacterized protein n=1 Tax=Toxoplasma gondii TgCatPRC2 TaxID=1130821 RepID=A0A151H7C0_TOXGO|nr:hypothetical protein TGPRC2_277730 [Toxoplasma gondii TgCatPRC2]